MNDAPPTKYRVRLRVRIAKSLTTKESSLSFKLGDKAGHIENQENGKTLEGAKWVVFKVGGFATEKEAEQAGRELKRVVELVGICDRLGIDVGQDKPTCSVNPDYFRQILGIPPEDRVWSANIHGLMIVPDDEHNRVPHVNIELAVTANLDQFIQAINEVSSNPPSEFSTSAKGIWLLNQALLTNEVLARIVLAISAVEEMGQDQSWSHGQLAIIKNLRDQVLDEVALGDERLEVAEAIKSIFRLSLRQGVLRLLANLGLSHLKKEWDEIYSRRSAIIHGAAAITDRELGEFADRTISLCGAVVLKAAELDGCTLPAITKVYFPQLS